jgi:hypothetical protein
VGYAAILFGCALFLFAHGVGAQATLPYVYYYSEPQNAFRIEQANGQEQHLLPVELTSEYGMVGGPGWSPDGEWFAWGFFQGGYENWLQGEVVHIDGITRLRTVELFNHIDWMYWSPDGEFLLVPGSFQLCIESPCMFMTHWLIDVSEDALIASFDISPGARGSGTQIEWLPNDEGVIFYEVDGVTFGSLANTRITMYTDGVVMKEPITQEEWNAASLPNPELSEEDAPITSPSGRYVISPATNELTDTEQEITIPIPSSTVGEGLQIIDARWHPSEEWVLLGYRNLEATRAVYATSVFSTDGSVYRELSTCGFAPACVGWLPDNVDVAQIPSAAD